MTDYWAGFVHGLGVYFVLQAVLAGVLWRRGLYGKGPSE